MKWYGQLHDMRFAPKTTILQITTGLEHFNATHCLNVLTMKQKPEEQQNALSDIPKRIKEGNNFEIK
jgi:hypothetical protein